MQASCVCNASLWLIALKLDIHNVLRASPKILGNIHAFIEASEDSLFKLVSKTQSSFWMATL